MKHLEAGLIAGLLLVAAYIVIMVCVIVGPLAWVGVGLFIGATIVAAIIDWKTEKKT